MSSANELWTLVELHPRGFPRQTSLQLLAKGQELTAKRGGCALAGIVLSQPGRGDEGVRQALRHGALKVYLLDRQLLGSPQSEVCAALLEELLREQRPQALLVAGGYGLGLAEAFREIEELARALGGAVGASKKVVDALWIPKVHLVGSSGHTVMPRLHVAIGISGASQHLRGMKAAGTVVAINTDPYAPIFQVADFGIVGDARKVIPVLLSELRGSNSRVKQLIG